mmetsp:Transcript_12830/g.38699  ORF Transcript_12830/g.38699 Transcript_12830/m.38699 type:complete len:100 (+) Transcript_12830:2879-3178(+)
MNYLKIELISYNPNFLKLFTKRILLKLEAINLVVVSLPKKRKIFSVLKSPFINKKAIEQFSITKYKKLLIVKQEQQKEVKKILERVPLKNIAIKIRKII